MTKVKEMNYMGLTVPYLAAKGKVILRSHYPRKAYNTPYKWEGSVGSGEAVTGISQTDISMFDKGVLTCADGGEITLLLYFTFAITSDYTAFYLLTGEVISDTAGLNSTGYIVNFHLNSDGTFYFDETSTSAKLLVDKIKQKKITFTRYMRASEYIGDLVWSWAGTLIHQGDSSIAGNPVTKVSVNLNQYVGYTLVASNSYKATITGKWPQHIELGKGALSGNKVLELNSDGIILSESDGGILGTVSNLEIRTPVSPEDK